MVVTNQANFGPGTLRTILPTAKNGDVITFAISGLLTNINSGGFVISNNVSIMGPGPGVLTILCTNWVNAVVASSGSTSSISGLTFTHCGTAIRNFGNLTMSNCVFTGNYSSGGNLNFNNGSSGGNASGGCGAIYNSNVLSVVNSQFMNNGAGGGGWGSPVPQYEIYGPNAYTTGGNGGNGADGGAVYDAGSVSFRNCTFSGNTAGNGGWGGYGASGTGTPAGGTHGNSPGPGYTGGNGGNGGNGGAVFTLTGAKFVNCTFYGNTAGAGGPGGPGGNAYLPGGYHIPYTGGNGGVGGNAGSCGSIYCTGVCQLVACTFNNNSAGTGGSGGNGGNGSSDLSGNSGPGGSGGNAGTGGSGGALYGPRTSSTNFICQNVLVAGNSYGYSGGAGSAGGNGGGHLTGTQGTNGIGAADGAAADVSGYFLSRGHNFVGISDGSSGFTNNAHNDLVGSGSAMDPMLNGLSDNGGPVYTCALQPGSPALDAGDDSLLGSPWFLASDARGYPRKLGAHVDIGAYEFPQLSLPVLVYATVTPNGVLLSVTNTPGVTFEVLGTPDLTLPVPNWDTLGQMNEVSQGVFQWVDTGYSDNDARFFQVTSP